ncbi:LysR family substrate-binding domain-containing protein [Streptomyces sp. NPDC059698]|uniref:LysR family substrate-binding domain-containing protein n=1 Tax=unclassified Streptomyces TaxID=2593676 RepID=UPI00093BB5F3|nr:LysR family substrate-binding domain-containing protein [Streptomyces sp. CB02366]OKJ36120.1 LysR family transcriptional regulator [Streptomyces sp. CB02366]TVP34593.1 LysR family transcriptional regulator [Streptomyces griseus subsp. griseus]
MTGSDTPSSFRLAYVPGVTPTKWVRVWHERLPRTPLELVQATAADAPGLLVDGGADAGLVRLPVDRSVLSAIPLYTETTVVVIPKDHVATAAEEVSLDDLSDEIVLHPLDDVLGWDSPPGRPAFERPATTADAVELVAAGVGVLLVPQSLARLHHRKDLTYRPVREAPESRIALSWPEAETTPDLVEEFIGIVRGRTVNSTRGRVGAERQRPTEKAKEKAGDKQRSGGSDGARQKPAAGGKPSSGGRSAQRAGGRGGQGGKRTGGQSGKRGKPRGR